MSFHLITGGSGSGKSAYAENCVTALLTKAHGPEQACSDSCDAFGRVTAFDQEHANRAVYIATMIPYGEDGKRRVERHRRLRREKNFETVECYTGLEFLDLHAYVRQAGPEAEQGESDYLNNARTGCLHSPDFVVLLECMSNLAANEMFEPNGAGEDTVAAILRGIKALRRQVRHLVVVTNEVFSDGLTYDAETMRYLSYLGAVNQAMAAQADTVTEVVYGIPVRLKG